MARGGKAAPCRAQLQDTGSSDGLGWSSKANQVHHFFQGCFCVEYVGKGGLLGAVAELMMEQQVKPQPKSLEINEKL
jgi:hypothetical protein